MSRPRGPRPFRKPLRARVGELLTTNPAIWLSGFAIGVVVLVMTSLVGALLGGLLLIPLVVVAAAVLDLRGRVMILRRRILFTRQTTTRRQFVAMMVSVFLVAASTGALGWILRGFILGSYDEQLRQHMTRRPKKR